MSLAGDRSDNSILPYTRPPLCSVDSFACPVTVLLAEDSFQALERTMRQLKGKAKKETSKDKKERKQAMQEARQQIGTVVLPTLAVVVLLIVVFVYVATRPGAIE